MRKKIKRLLVIALVFSFFITNGFAFYDGYRKSDHIINTVKAQQDVQIIFYDNIAEFQFIIQNDDNLSSYEKDNILASLCIDQTQKDKKYKYYEIRQKLIVDETYACYPYFYIKTEDVWDELTVQENQVIIAKLDRNYNGKTKHFNGTLYYHEEENHNLYWDLNGDFYDNGVIRDPDAPILRNTALVSFNVMQTNDFYKYICQNGRILLDHTYIAHMDLYASLRKAILLHKAYFHHRSEILL